MLAVSRRNDKAWETLYRLNWPFVRAIVYRRLGSVEGLAEDATQEVFYRLIRSCPFPSLRDPEAFRGYIWRVSDNVARTYRRRLLSRQELSVPGDPEEVADPIPPQGQQEVELQELMEESWQQLSLSERHLLSLLVAGHTIKDIAKKIDVSYGAAAIRVWRLRAKLHKSLVLNGILAAEIK